MNRRTFVTSLAAAGAVAATPRIFASESSSPIKVGLIGCGWFGNVNLGTLRRTAKIEVVSLCDVNRKFLSDTVATVMKDQSTSPATYADYREMLKAHQHDIVIVATPDHWHALPAIAAMKAGADVLLEKPIGVDVLEGEAMLAAARKYKSVVQVNLQRPSVPLYHQAREKYLESGVMGRIGLVEMFCHLGHRRSNVVPETSPPEHLDYEFWIGPAPKIPFMNAFEKAGWRHHMEFGNGTIGDMGVHLFDLVRWLNTNMGCT